MSAEAVAEKTSIQATENNEENTSSSNKRLAGKVAVITGGADGIGKATVELFAKHGAKLIIGDVNEKLGVALADSLPDATFIRCDVTFEDDIKNLINAAISRHGRLDILFNNAGILGRYEGNNSILNFDADEFDKVMSVNVRGGALGIKHAASVMIPRGGGCIISTASVSGVTGALGPHTYTASKHAIVGLTKNTACELGRYGIRVNCISPGAVPTSMLLNALSPKSQDSADEEAAEKTEKMLRGIVEYNAPALKAIDIAEAALYLASDESRYVTGHNLIVDGGLTASKNVIGLF